MPLSSINISKHRGFIVVLLAIIVSFAVVVAQPVEAHASTTTTSYTTKYISNAYHSGSHKHISATINGGGKNYTVTYYCDSCMGSLTAKSTNYFPDTIKIDGVKYYTYSYYSGSTLKYSWVVKPASYKKVTSVKLSSSSATVQVGSTTTLKATVSPSTASIKGVIYTSSNTSVATVGSTTGIVRGQKAGTATITAFTHNGKTATCKVTVKSNVAVTKVSLSSSKVVLSKGGTKTLKATVSPSNATSKTVSWSSADTSIATVSSSGKITAKSAGVTTITAKTSNGKKATCKVIVTGYVDTSSAYTQLNSFRTTKGVWYWNSNNKTKTYFNKSGYTTLKKLSKNSKLVTTAKTRAKELATLYSHTRPNGKSCFTIYPSSSYRGENIAAGQTTCTSVMTAWKETNEKYSGQGHRRNMLSSKYNAVGIAGYVASDGVTYWCMALAKI